MTLTELSYYSRKSAPFALLFFLILLILYYLIRVLLITISPPSKPSIHINPIFDKIKKPQIANTMEGSGLKFTIDTIEGKPITATESANVYFLPSATTRFGYREKIYLIAKTLGFNTEAVKHKLEGKEATFADDKRKLQIDITNFNFTYEYSFDSEPEIFQNTTIPTKKEIEDKATNFLKSLGRYPEELAQGKTNIIFVNYEPEEKMMKLVEAGMEANMVEVDFYRPDQEQYPVVSPSYFNSQNYVMMVFYPNEFKIIKAQIRFFEKSESQIGIYPIKSGDAAWGELVAGKGMIVQNPQDEKDIIINKMFLAYLDPEVYQEYLQPVYVFLGENNFVAYVPAVVEEYFTQE